MNVPRCKSFLRQTLLFAFAICAISFSARADLLGDSADREAGTERTDVFGDRSAHNFGLLRRQRS